MKLTVKQCPVLCCYVCECLVIPISADAWRYYYLVFGCSSVFFALTCGTVAVL